MRVIRPFASGSWPTFLDHVARVSTRACAHIHARTQTHMRTHTHTHKQAGVSPALLLPKFWQQTFPGKQAILGFKDFLHSHTLTHSHEHSPVT
jgi:hypothetical protein